MPLDRPGSGLTLTKSVSAPVASTGERILYTLVVGNADRARRTGVFHVTDLLPPQLRLVADSVRVDTGTVRISSPDGRASRFDLPALAPTERRTIRYLAEVRPGAEPGTALNRAQANDDFGTQSQVADAVVRIERDALTERMTVVGRVTDGGCAVDSAIEKGVAGVRVLMEDGSFAVTDLDGRYHLDGIRPETHVVQLDSNTLPEERVAIDCVRSTRSAGSATSRFVRGSGGELARADFRVTAGDSGERLAARTLARPPIETDGFAAGGEGRDWLADQTPGIAWLFPGNGDNPRAKVIRVVVKHRPGQAVTLRREGEAVDALNMDGTVSNADRTLAVTSWRGLALTGRDTRFTADVRDEAGALVETLTRTVHFADRPLLDGRLVLYAKGRVLGRWLLTASYNTDKERDDTRFAET